MKPAVIHENVVMISIDRIDVLNPRSRNKKQHLEIVENIRSIGLKRPITVSRRTLPDGSHRYNLICGQGRLEAFKLLDQDSIPAFVTEASEEDCLVMSLVENIARRQHRPIDLMREVGELRKRGHNDSEIAQRIGVTPSWVNMIAGLLEKGEEKLLSAVEAGSIPLSMATDIARSSDAELQNLLAGAYQEGFRGKKLSTLRKLLEQRIRRDKAIGNVPLGKSSKKKPLTASDLRNLYELEAEKLRIRAKKAEFTHERIIFAAEAIKDLLENEEFTILLKTEGKDTLPKLLKDRISGEARA
ncbi:plasmid partitioning protein RepB C-terminal domain-containing protein [Zoogloea sp.]|uniref:plasmid partitioning protein RepB C-terminal domain-containing protein n=1 Tax=Zoogloea sp. TaxID=49181 RepID=UPI001415FA7D|nr:MAG: ParB/RepB/Spo0J family partition protein [Zoogloea sp.]